MKSNLSYVCPYGTVNNLSLAAMDEGEQLPAPGEIPNNSLSACGCCGTIMVFVDGGWRVATEADLLPHRSSPTFRWMEDLVKLARQARAERIASMN